LGEKHNESLVHVPLATFARLEIGAVGHLRRYMFLVFALIVNPWSDIRLRFGHFLSRRPAIDNWLPDISFGVSDFLSPDSRNIFPKFIVFVQLV
jgi:hypothetical protein